MMPLNKETRGVYSYKPEPQENPNFPTLNHTVCKKLATPSRFYQYDNEVIASIKPTTTPVEFEAICNKFPSFKLENGNTRNHSALHMAAFKGNLALVQHIVAKGGRGLLDLGNENGSTPLMVVALHGVENDQDPQAADSPTAKMAAELIRLGSNIHIATRSAFSFSVGERREDGTYLTHNIPSRATAMHAAAEIIKNAEIVKMLIQAGANQGKNLSPEAQELIKTAQIQRLMAVADPRNLLYRLPPDVQRVVISFYKNQN